MYECGGVCVCVRERERERESNCYCLRYRVDLQVKCTCTKKNYGREERESECGGLERQRDWEIGRQREI